MLSLFVGSPPVSKIVAGTAPGGMRVGAFASVDIEAEKPYLAVPTSLIMDIESAEKCVPAAVVGGRCRV